MRLQPVRRPHPGLSKPALLALAGVIALVAWRWSGDVRAQSALTRQTHAQATPVVVVTSPQAASAPDTLVLPGTARGWSEAPVYARTAGYVKRWVVDIGDTVLAGQLLAEIDAPELDQQLKQAQADVATADTQAQQAKATSDRVSKLLPSQAVSPQEAGDRLSDARVRSSALASASANLQRLQALAAFKQVRAPFAGTVTARNADAGTLVSGSNSGTPLFTLSDGRRLRVDVQAPEALAAGIHVRDEAEVVPGGSGWKKPLPARVLASAGAVNPAARTVKVQLELGHADDQVLPGGYVEVRFKQPVRGNALRLPGNGLLFRGDGLRVATVDAQGVVHLRDVVQGRDFGKEVEILSGISAQDRVILNPSDAIRDGDIVRVQDAKTRPSGS